MSLSEILSKINMTIAEFDEWCRKRQPLDFTLLTKEQIWGDKDGTGQLDVMKKYGTAVAPTDLAILLGSIMSWDIYHTSEGDLSCFSWSVSSDGDGDVHSVHCNGGEYWNSMIERDISVRPALPPFEVSKITPKEVKTINGIRIAEYGEYPQTVVEEHIGGELERLLESKSLQPTGKNYTFDSVGLRNYDTPFKATSYPEYELNGKKYIRVPGCPDDSESHLSTGEKVAKKKPYWIQVQPIEWLVDKSGIWVSKKCLFAGIQFDTKEKYDGDFSKTFMKHYLDTYFAKEMGHEEIVAKREQEQEKQRLDKVLIGLSAQLEEATSNEAVEAIKKRFKAAENGKKTQTPPDRLDEAARMQRLMNARNILIHAAQQAYDAGDKALLDGIVDLSQHYEVLYNARRRRVASLQARRRVQRKQGDR